MPPRNLTDKVRKIEGGQVLTFRVTPKNAVRLSRVLKSGRRSSQFINDCLDVALSDYSRFVKQKADLELANH